VPVLVLVFVMVSPSYIHIYVLEHSICEENPLIKLNIVLLLTYLSMLLILYLCALIDYFIVFAGEVSLMVSRTVLTELCNILPNILPSLEDSFSETISKFILQKVQTRVISFEDQVGLCLLLKLDTAFTLQSFLPFYSFMKYLT